MRKLRAMIIVIAGFSLAAFCMDLGPENENDMLTVKGGEVNECGYCLGGCFFYDHDDSEAIKSDCFTCNKEEQGCCCAFAAVGSVASYIIFGPFACCLGKVWAKTLLTAVGSADGAMLCAACACHTPLCMAKHLGAEHFKVSHRQGKYCRPKDRCSCTSLGCGYKGEKVSSCFNNCLTNCLTACDASCDGCGSCCLVVGDEVVRPAQEACKTSCRSCFRPCFHNYD